MPSRDAEPIAVEVIDRAVREFGRPVHRPTVDGLSMGLVVVSPENLRTVPVTGMRVLWAGSTPDRRPAVVAAALRPDGSAAVAFGVGGADGTVSISRAQVERVDRLDTTLVALHMDTSLVVVAPRAVRAEVSLPGGAVRPVPLAHSGGTTALQAATAAKSRVRAYAADGSLVGEMVPVVM